jgi:hypothetical protein
LGAKTSLLVLAECVAIRIATLETADSVGALMEPKYPPKRGLVLILLAIGIFYLVAAVLSLYCWLAFSAWRPYLGQIAVAALLISIPLTYLVWGYYEQRRKP